MIVESAFVGKTGDVKLLLNLTPDNTISESLEVSDTLGLGIPAILADFTAKQSLSAFETELIEDIDPNGITFDGAWEIVELPSV